MALVRCMDSSFMPNKCPVTQRCQACACAVCSLEPKPCPCAPVVNEHADVDGPRAEARPLAMLLVVRQRGAPVARAQLGVVPGMVGGRRGPGVGRWWP